MRSVRGGIAALSISIAVIMTACSGHGSNSTDNTSVAKHTFIMIHLEAGYKACKENDLPPGLSIPEYFRLKDLGWQEFFWPTVIELVEKANEYGFKLTLAFTPQWGKFIANESTRLNLVRQWQAQGHEIGFQHHALTHSDWDGYANMYSKGTDTVNDTLYLGPVNDGFSYVNTLASPGNIISSTTGSLPDDFPSLMTSPTLIYGEGDAGNSYRRLGPVRSLVPVKSRVLIGTIERDLIHLTIRVFSTVMKNMLVDDALPILQDEYRKMTGNEVFGIVWHEFDYYQRKDAYIQWFDFIKANGNSIKTINETAGEYFK